MVADIATVTSFVVLVFLKLFTVPLFFDWLTLLKDVTDYPWLFLYAIGHHSVHESSHDRICTRR
jgi:hypothetical protein